MSDFSWDTEEENEEIWEAGAEATPSPPRRWPLILLLISLVVAGGWLLYRQVSDRIDTAVSEAKEGVLASQAIVWQAHREQDGELLGNILSGRDVNWVEAQFAALNQGILYDRPFIDLATLPITRPLTADDITISPDLTVATATLRLPYTLTTTDLNITTPVTLAHTAVYRRGSDRWLLSPLDGSAWEATERLETTYLSVRYPSADAELVEQLTTDLNRTLSDVCNKYFDLNCGPTNTRFNLTFSARPQALLAAAQSTETAGQNIIMTVPTPALMGRPADANAYRLLYRGYARLIAADLLERSLLEEWADRGYDEIYTAARRIRPVQLRWADPPPAPPSRFTAVDTPQEIALLCLERENTTLMRFDPAHSRLQPMLPSDRRLVAIEPAPEDDALALRESWQQRGAPPSTERLLAWPFVSARPLELQFLPHARQDEIMWRPHPQQARLLWEPPRTGSDAPDITGYRFQNCTADGCDIVTDTFSSRHIIWSPNGNHTLLTTNDGHLFLGDGNGDPIRYIDEGGRSFWVDNATFRYVRFLRDTRTITTSLYTGSTEEVTPTLSISPTDLAPALRTAGLNTSATTANDFLFIHADRVVADPQQTILVALRRDDAEAGLYMWRYDHRTDTADFLLRRTDVHKFLPSPNGRFMLLSAAETDSATAELYDSQTGRVFRYPIRDAGRVVLDWSLTDNWFLVLADGVLTVGRPEQDVAYVARPDNLGGCFDAGWINRRTP